VQAVPMALSGLWGSLFSRAGTNVFSRLFKGIKTTVCIDVGDSVDADKVSASMLQDKVQSLQLA